MLRKAIVFFFACFLVETVDSQTDLSGAIWEELVTFDGRDVMFLYDDKDYLYAGIGGQGLLRSDDSGLTWEAVNTQGIRYTPSSLVFQNGNFYLTTLDKGIWKSKKGFDFIDITTNLPPLGVWKSTVHKGDLYISTSDGVYRQDNQGFWVKENLPKEYWSEKLFDIYSKAGLLATGGRERLYLKDNQDNWSVVPFSFTYDIRNIVIFNNQTIWVGTNGNGAYLSTDRGNTWTSLNIADLGGNVIFLSKSEKKDMLRIGDGGIYDDMGKIGIKPDTFDFKNVCLHKNQYFAGTTSHGIYTLSQPASAKPSVLKSTFISEFSVYPNPSTGDIVVRISGEPKTVYDLKIYSYAGILIAAHQIVANNPLQVDLSVPPGIYLVEVSRSQTLVHRTSLIIVR